MKKDNLLEMTGYKVIRYFKGKDWNGKKVYIYLFRSKEGQDYRIRKYDVKDFIERGATYEEIN